MSVRTGPAASGLVHLPPALAMTLMMLLGLCGKAGAQPIISDARLGPPATGAVGAIAGRGVLQVQMTIVSGCSIEVTANTILAPRCARNEPVIATLVSDVDPDFNETIAFGTRQNADVSGSLARVTALRLTVDY